MGQSLGILNKIFHGLLQSSRQISHMQPRLLHSHSSINPDIRLFLFCATNSVFKKNGKFIVCVFWGGGARLAICVGA